MELPQSEPTQNETPTSPARGDSVGSFLRHFGEELRRQVGGMFGRVLNAVSSVEGRRGVAAEGIKAPRGPSVQAPLASGLPLHKLKHKFESRQEARRQRQERLRRDRERREQVQLTLDMDNGEDVESAEMTPSTEETEAGSDTRSIGSVPVVDKDMPPWEDVGDESVGDGLGETAREPSEPYRLPGAELLCMESEAAVHDPEELKRKSLIIQETLDSFGIDADVIGAVRGPRVTLFKVDPARGVPVEAISRISNNIAMELAAVSLRILAPVPGQDYVGIEVPNQHEDVVRFGSLMTGDLWARSRARIPLLVGRNINGGDVVLDLTKAPHLLIAGATGSGKSVCLNGMLMSLLYRFDPEDLRLILVDPKVVEFSVYNSLPHLIIPVITDTSKVVMALRWVIREMERRYQLMSKVGARNLEGFNSRTPDEQPVYDDEGNVVPVKLPYVVVVIDELADIMMTARADVENNLARIAQMSRAVGIHTIIATQRPSVNVITGVIKANYPTRVAFQVSSQIDSRTIIDGKGAESLLGRGDMLFNPPGASRLQRLQGAMVDDGEIERVVAFCSEQSEQVFDLDVLNPVTDDAPAVEFSDEMATEDEALISQAIEIVVQGRRASTSYIQRRLRIGYNRAATLVEILEQRGIIGPQVGSLPREILVDGAFEDDE